MSRRGLLSCGRVVPAAIVGSLLALSLWAAPAAAATDLQAEDATVAQGAVESNHAGFTGTGFVNYDNVAGSYVEWTVTATTAGPTTLGIRFANGSTLARPMNIAVNGVAVTADAGFAPTGAWSAWATLTVGATLNAGANTVRATAVTAQGGPNVDALAVGAQPGGAGVMAAPYVYTGWGDPPNIRTVMNATGVKQFTMAFMLSGGGCVPRWDSARPLRGGQDEAMINAIRAGGGDVQISFGGWSGNKLGPNCSSPTALANAYQQVIDAYNLKYIDIDIENTDEFENFTVMDRILNAMRIIKQNNPGITTIITFGTSINGPTGAGSRLIRQAAALNSNFDVFTIMPFDFGCTGAGRNMFDCTVSATEGLKNQLKAVFGWTDAQAYAHIGISGMNGKSDVNETTTTGHWTQIRDWANQRHLARLAFWSVNRDRPCSGGLAENCSGVSQSAWQFTRITAGFTG
jgi:chitinase